MPLEIYTVTNVLMQPKRNMHPRTPCLHVSSAPSVVRRLVLCRSTPNGSDAWRIGGEIMGVVNTPLVIAIPSSTKRVRVGQKIMFPQLNRVIMGNEQSSMETLSATREPVLATPSRAPRKRKRCEHDTCDKSAAYGPGRTAMRCKDHRLATDVDTRQKWCEVPGCTTGPNFGQPGGRCL